MDSFEWFGEIGNQPYDSLKPPGDINRETFCTARMGLESFGGGGGGGGGNKKAQKQAHKYNVEKWDFDYDTQIQQYEHTLAINAAQRKDNETSAAFKEQERGAAYDHALLTRAFNQNEKLRSRELVLDRISQQLTYNDKARENSHRTSMQVALERQEKLILNAQKSAAEYQQSADKLELQAGKSRLDYRTKMEGLNIAEAATLVNHRVQTRALQNKKTLSTLAFQDKAADLAFKQVSSVRERIKAVGKTRLLQAGQSADATNRDVIAAFRFQDSMILDKMKRSDHAYRAEQFGVDNAMIGLAGQRYYEVAKQALERGSTVEARKLQIKAQESEQRYLNVFRAIRRSEERATGKSISAAYDRMIEDVDMKWEGAKIAAEAKIPMIPNLAPAPIKPLALPRGQIIDPPRPEKGPKPRKGSSYSPGGAVKGSMTGSILGGLSAGASALGAFGSMAATGGGAIGLGSMGAIGLGAMGPIGLGIGAIAAVGSIFNWW